MSEMALCWICQMAMRCVTLWAAASQVFVIGGGLRRLGQRLALQRGIKQPSVLLNALIFASRLRHLHPHAAVSTA